jgi:hypothetical protein
MRGKLNLSLDEQVISNIKNQTRFATVSAYIADLVQRDHNRELAYTIDQLQNKLHIVLEEIKKPK